MHRTLMARRPLPGHIALDEVTHAAVSSAVEHVFAGRRNRMDLFIRAIGIDRAPIKFGIANLAHHTVPLLTLRPRRA